MFCLMGGHLSLSMTGGYPHPSSTFVEDPPALSTRGGTPPRFPAHFPQVPEKIRRERKDDGSFQLQVKITKPEHRISVKILKGKWKKHGLQIIR